ncbi:MAG: HutD family protein [Lachnospiraceae bacterium]|nr:HutD family protein [Lachnospiraceae bacterium]
MSLSFQNYDEKRVRILLKTGEFFEGEVQALTEEYCLHELGREEEALQISGEDEEALVDHWVFYADEISRIELLPEPEIPETPPRLLYYLCENEIKTTPWSGGQTSEFFLYPWQASYARRDFLWRISSARVEAEESDFTLLPDYHRFITPLRGSMNLRIDRAEAHLLKPLEVLSFDGGAATHSEGICTDFNLMLRKGKAVGGMEGCRLREEWTALYVPPRARHYLLYCPAGQCCLRTPYSEILLGPDRPLLMVENPDHLTLSARSPEGADLVWAWAARLPLEP